MSTLQIAPDLGLPLDAITQSIALLAVKRAGKSNAAAVMAEEMYHAGLPWVAIDPKGDWWGLRSDKDGTGPGLPIPIFGGLHGDMPLLPEAGRLIADLIVDENLTCILDVSEWNSEAQQMRFLTDLGKRLFQRHGRQPHPRHLFLEEADDFIPQTVRADQAPCVGAWTKLVKQGGQRGLGVTIISQRSAVVNKNALTQCDTLIAMRTTGPQDRKAISDWVSYHAVARELVDSLPGLDDGEAWVCSPHWLAKRGLPAIQKVRFRRRATFDSGATPTMERNARPPATLADIDLGALAGQMEEVTAKAAQDDPKALRRKVAELERRLATGAGVQQKVAALETEIEGLRAELAIALTKTAEQVPVPVLGPDAAAALERAVESLGSVAAVVGGHADSITAALGRTRPGSPQRPAPSPRQPAPRPAQPAARAPVAPPAPPEHTSAEPVGADPDFRLGKAHRAILRVLAQSPDGRERRPVAVLAGYSSKAGHFSNALGELRRAGLIEPGMPLRITDAGLEALGPDWEPLPTGVALIDYWMGQLGKAEREILRALLEVYPESLTRAEIAERAGYQPKAGHFGNSLGRLRSLELISGSGEMKAEDTLGEHAQSGARP